jgi:hypothetical protein|tara:strand:+ start:2955 stop:3836 length:882 start_codon:yes stop_codon:yes gene_type:complete
MAIIYNKNRKKGLFYIPSGGLGPSVSAEFAYGKASYNQAEADPTPTITGTTGGTFSSDAGVSFIDTSTGQIDLSASTIATHAITYIVDGVQSTQNVGITAAPYSSTRSFSFDGVNDYFDLGSNFYQVGSGDVSISAWINPQSQLGNNDIIGIGSNGGSRIRLQRRGNNFGAYINGSGLTGSALTGSTTITNGVWYHLMLIKSGTTFTLYVNTTSEASGTFTGTFDSQEGIIGAYFGGGSGYINGNIDEVSIWNSALSSDAITEIYNSGAGNFDLTNLTHTSSSNLKAWLKMGE